MWVLGCARAGAFLAASGGARFMQSITLAADLNELTVVHEPIEERGLRRVCRRTWSASLRLVDLK